MNEPRLGTTEYEIFHALKGIRNATCTLEQAYERVTELRKQDFERLIEDMPDKITLAIADLDSGKSTNESFDMETIKQQLRDKWL